MKGKMKPAICCTVSALTLSMAVSMVSLAEIPDASASNQESDWTYRAVADVTDELFIRSGASATSKIIGYLPSAGGAYVLEKGNEWTKVRSGEVVGYIKTEYLAFGEDAKNLAEVYGTPGVEISWDGVNIFDNANPAAKIVKTADRGTGYETISNDGAWVSIQMGDSGNAYVPAEDVKDTLILEEAVPADDYVSPVSAYSDGAADASSSNGGTQSWNVEDVPETEPTWMEAPESEEDWTETAETDTVWAEAPETEEAWTDESGTGETWTDESGTEEAWTDESGTEETWTDESGTEEIWTEVPETEAIWTEDAETETPEAEVPETEETWTEAPETNVSADASSDDLTLLASIIYCEAGNQPWDGKVAVGAVVLNRVASSSFAGSIHDVIYEGGQFMPTWDGSMSNALANGVPSDCYEAAQAALNGENPVGGALFFNTGSGQGIKIGAHQFY